MARTCPRCQGGGEINASPCESCQGRGHIREKRALKVRIPAGVDDGSRLRLVGEGEAGDEGMPAGDLYVVTRVRKHPFFERDGNDLVCEIARLLHPGRARAPGSRSRLSTGTRSSRSRPERSRARSIRLKGQGVQDVSGRRQGDLFVKVLVRTPDNLSKDQKALLGKLAELRGEDIESVDKSVIHRLKNILQ